MLCPHCKVELKIADRQGIEIDYCPQCRGVWLDRGELDKILERSAGMMPAAGPQRGYAQQPPPSPQAAYQQQPPPRGSYRRDDDDDDDWDDDDRRRHYGQPGYGQPGYGQPGYPPRRRRESWLSDLFDFD